MYQSIYNYAINQHISKEKNRCYRKIACYILLKNTGEYDGYEYIGKDDRIPKRCPDVGKYYTSGMASPICDKKQTIFGDKKHSSFIELMKLGESECNEFYAVNIFLESINQNEKLLGRVNHDIEKVKDDEFISFRVNNTNLEDQPSWEKWFDSVIAQKQPASKESISGVSSLSGNYVELIAGKNKFPMCKGGNAFGTGVPLFSNSHKKEAGTACAFKSYGAGSEACPMSMEEAETIQAGLEYLMNSEHNHSDEFSLIYWFDGDVPDTISPLLARTYTAPKEEEYKKLLESVIEVQEPRLKKANKDIKYHILKYNTPDKGRLSLSREKSGTYNELAENIRKWLQDTAIESKKSSVIRLNNIWAVLFGLMEKKDPQDKIKEIKNEYGEARYKLLDSVFSLKQVPHKVIHMALKQIEKSMVYNYYNTDDENVRSKYSPWTALMILKVYLIREGENMQMQLDTENTNIGYLCGRWLAVLDKLQSDSQGDSRSKVTMGQKMYKGCTKQPAKVLNLCSENKGVYLGKLAPEFRKRYEVIFGEIADKMPTGFPDKFSILEEAAFHIGYAQQRQSMFKKNEKSAEDEVIDNSKL